jgi:uncharacterized protein YbjT (DUF2867 family)
MIKNILVIGATGMLGKPVTNALVKAGFNVSVMARDPLKAKKSLPSGVSVLKGDIRNVNEITSAMEGQDAVYLSLSIKQTEKQSEFHSEEEGMRNLITAAKEKNIKRIAYLSSLVMFYQGMNGFNWWVFDIKHKAVKMIKESGIPYSIFYPSNFMESLSGMYKQGKMLMLSGKSKHPMYFISAVDYGNQVARSFTLLKDENKEYNVQGKEAFTADEAVKIFKANYKKEKLFISKAPLGMLKFFGRFNTKMNYGANIITALNNYPEKFHAEVTWKELGEPEMTVKKYASESE